MKPADRQAGPNQGEHTATGGVSSNWDMPDFLEDLHYLHHDMRVLPALDTSLTGFLDVIIRCVGVPVGGRTWGHMASVRQCLAKVECNFV